MHLYLRGEMQEIAQRRKNHVSVQQRIKFAIYKANHLEKLIQDINDHIDGLYKICTPPAKDQDSLGRAELVELLKVMEELKKYLRARPTHLYCGSNSLGAEGEWNNH
ncbi:hypothetical protein N7495_007750 [Penicillium taxi]|uniref:uncharacterized protein n=1 Tax=Penicillium taxi TaxID=168475 RepID=UPI002545AD03|nr:uncharacterized protein N7495_007750 [Penicillium taxi]KAJ5887709.1 hypothetical protein N7495_007750 [Penicillium taxi]